MRKVIAVLSMIAIIISVSIHVKAADEALISAMPKLSFTGTTATCSLKVYANYSTDHIEASVKLMHGSTIIKQWNNLSDYGYMDFSDTATVVSEYTYTMKVTLKVNGVSYNVADITKTCP